MMFIRKKTFIISIFFIATHFNIWSVRLGPLTLDYVNEIGMELVSSIQQNNYDTGIYQKQELYTAENGVALSVSESYNMHTGDHSSEIKIDYPQSEFNMQSINVDLDCGQKNCEVFDFATSPANNSEVFQQSNQKYDDDYKDFALDGRRQEMQENARTQIGDSETTVPLINSANNISYRIKVDKIDLAKLIQEKIISNEVVMKQLLDEKVILEKQLSKWFQWPSTKQIIQQKIAFINALQNGSLVEIISTIQKSNIRKAIQTFARELRPLWPWPHKLTHLIEQDNKPDENAFIKILGINIMKEAESYWVSRSDFLARLDIIPQVRDFERQCYKDLVVGNINNLLLQKTKLQSDLLKYQDIVLWEIDPQALGLCRAKLVITESLLADSRLQIYSTISQAKSAIAYDEYNYLEAQLKDYFASQSLKSPAAQRADMIRREGFDILTVAKTHLEIRFENVSKHLEPVHRMLSTIKNENLKIAQEELIDLKQQFEKHCDNQNIKTDVAMHEHITQCEGFNVPEFADALFASRPDHPNHVTQHDILCHKKLLIEEIEQKHHKEIFIAQAQIIEALSVSTNHQMVADKLSTMRDAIYYNAAQYDLVVTPEASHQVQWSLNALSQASNPEVFTFHLATIEHVLHDVQKQTAIKANIPLSLVERSPELITRFVQQYFLRLNPVTQISEGLSFIVNSARYIADVTVGKLYLTETAYEERTNQFWEFVDALKNLNQLEAEQWVDVVSQLAADMTCSFGVGKTLHYLKEIDAIGKTQRQAARIANQLKKGLDAALTERPILITAEGMAIQAPKAAEELALLQKSIHKAGGAAKETIKDTKGLLQAESELNSAAKNYISSAKELRPYTHEFKYHSRIRSRALNDPISHNFPYSFDDHILKVIPIIQNDGSLLYRLEGTLNKSQGFFEIAINQTTKTIFHRCFVSKK